MCFLKADNISLFSHLYTYILALLKLLCIVYETNVWFAFDKENLMVFNCINPRHNPPRARMLLTRRQSYLEKRFEMRCGPCGYGCQMLATAASWQVV